MRDVFGIRSPLHVFVSLCCASVVFAEQAQDTASVMARIQHRQESIHSAKFSWTQQTFEAKGARLDPSEVDANSAPTSNGVSGAKKLVPSEDVEYTHPFSFTFDGAKTNFVSEQRGYDNSNKAHHLNTRRTFDGTSQFSIRQPWGQTNYPYGTIYKDDGRNRDLGLLFLEPILQCYRLPTPETSRNQGGNFELDNTEIEIRGVKTIALSVRTPKLRRVLSLDPAREYLPVRYSLESDDHVQRQTDFEYRSDPQVGWVLSGWEIAKFSQDGAMTHRHTATVREYEINPRLEPAEFEITFPPGTLIDDLKEDAGFIQRADGTRRRIVPSEYGKPFKELLNTDPELIHTNKRDHTMLILGNIILLSIAAIFFVSKWRRRGGNGKMQSG